MLTLTSSEWKTTEPPEPRVLSSSEPDTTWAVQNHPEWLWGNWWGDNLLFKTSVDVLLKSDTMTGFKCRFWQTASFPFFPLPHTTTESFDGTQTPDRIIPRLPLERYVTSIWQHRTDNLSTEKAPLKNYLEGDSMKILFVTFRTNWSDFYTTSTASWYHTKLPTGSFLFSSWLNSGLSYRFFLL